MHVMNVQSTVVKHVSAFRRLVDESTFAVVVREPVYTIADCLGALRVWAMISPWPGKATFQGYIDR